jgi:hypothetical protein
MQELAPSGPVQWPFLGVVVLLILLIFATPGLLAVGQPNAGSPATQAVLVLYRGPGANYTEFHVQGVSFLAYHRISVGIASQFSGWPVVAHGSHLNFTRWVNVSDSLSVQADSGANPVAINVSAVFVDSSGGSVQYFGLYAFNLTGSTYVIQPLLTGLDSGSPSLRLSDLPQGLPLLTRSGSGP